MNLFKKVAQARGGRTMIPGYRVHDCGWPVGPSERFCPNCGAVLRRKRGP